LGIVRFASYLLIRWNAPGDDFGSGGRDPHSEALLGQIRREVNPMV
jgi:hypothetical protein